MNRSILVVYRSKTGFTARYAAWLAEALSCRAISLKEAKKSSLAPYDAVVYGGGFCAGKIGGLDWFKKQLPLFKDKTFAVFATGAMPPNTPDVEKALRQNFTNSEWRRLRVFYLQSGLCYEKMGVCTKFMMWAFRRMLAKQKDKTSVEMSRAVAASYDNCSKEQLSPLIAFLSGEDAAAGAMQ